MAARMKVAFAGTPEFARDALAAILAAGFDVPIVLTQPDRPAGRGMKLQASPVKQLAQQHGITVSQPHSLRRDGKYPDEAAAARDALLAAAPDVMVVAAYGLILPQWTLDLPRLGCLIMQMDAGLDTGDMLLVEREAIGPDDTTAVLHDRLASLGGRLIVEALEMAACGGLTRTPQPEAGVTYAHKIEKAEAAIDWSLPADVIARRVHAFDPFPGCTFTVTGDKGPETHKVWAAQAVSGQGVPGQVLQAQGDTLVVACGTGALVLQTLQKPGGKRVRAREFLQSTPLQPVLT